MSKQLELIDSFPIKFKINDDKRTIISDSDGIRKDYNLVCEVDATHSGTLINNRIYPPELMKKGIKTWTSPYKKPILVNHNDDQDPIGRVIKAKYIKTIRGEENRDEYKPILKISDGYGYQRLTVKVTDPSAIQKILDGRYETVSVRMSTNHAFCSVCNSDWSKEGPCEHTPGQTYDKKLAFITTGDLSYKELSFVNVPADELAGVKEALLKENEDSLLEPSVMSLYANSSEDKVLSDLSSNGDFNLYNMLENDSEEGDDVVLHLLDKTSKVFKYDKEEDVKLDELTKDKLRDLKLVQEMVAEEVKKALEEDKKKAKAECEEVVSKIKEDHKKQIDALPKGDDGCKKAIDELKTSITTITKERDDLVKETGISKDELTKKEEDRKRLLDENIKINSDLHKMVAERLYDLKRILRKPDVVDVKTPDEHNKKVEEFAQRSIDSLKDQISDLLLEQETLLSNNYFGKVDNPGAVKTDKTNEVEDSKPNKKEGKKETLNRLFSKS